MKAVLSSWSAQAHSALTSYILPFGMLILLTGMFWISERPDYHRAFYITLAFPTLLALLLAPRQIKNVCSNGIYLAFLFFAAYFLFSLAWSGTDNATLSLIKRPIYISMLFFSATLITINNELRTYQILLLSISIAATCALISMGHFIYFDTSLRLPGYRSLYNPLLTSHVYGMFAAMCVALLLILKKGQLASALIALTILFTLLLMTGSRTPLIGILGTCIWLALLLRNRLAFSVLIIVIALGVLLLIFNPENVTSRGLSYRPEIWHQAWLQIQEHLWLGHGYGHPMVFWVEGISYAFADPHNMELAVLFSGGIVGLLLWLAIYITALLFAWRNRHDRLVLLASSALVFGFAAGLTEGNSFLSRPKEHWFLIWIPFSLLAAVWAAQRAKHHAQTS